MGFNAEHFLKNQKVGREDCESPQIRLKETIRAHSRKFAAKKLSLLRERKIKVCRFS